MKQALGKVEISTYMYLNEFTPVSRFDESVGQFATELNDLVHKSFRIIDNYPNTVFAKDRFMAGVKVKNAR